MSQTQVSTQTSARELLKNRYVAVRAMSIKLADPLQPEDCVVQSMDDVSPTKWHLGHMAWFFEQVILEKFVANYTPFKKDYYFVFNSYYESFGERCDRPLRGTLSRPTLAEALEYRRVVDERMNDLFDSISDSDWSQFAELVEIGLQHEQQHQELALTDIKHVFGSNPLHPVYNANGAADTDHNANIDPLKFVRFEGGVMEIGAKDNTGFYYDNEGPRHKTYLQDFSLADRLITCGEYLEFIKDGGYTDTILWLSDGWAVVSERGWRHPLYWRERDGQWEIHTLSGVRALNPYEPVCHVSYYEALAFARWANKRLPTEAEWEIAAESQSYELESCNLMSSGIYHPRALRSSDSTSPLKQMIGDVWEWTGSAYLPYPGYKQEAGALGEYNGKFMSDQMVLRGGSCATASYHIRTTYRNFFQCDKRWQFTGIRLADEA